MLAVDRPPRWTRTFAEVIVALLTAFAAAAAFGFDFAAWRAETRLADELPRDWEGIDITLVGVIDDYSRTPT